MANKKEVLTGIVEQVVDERLETVGGFTSEECVNAIKNANMRKAVQQYAKAFEAGRKSDWDRAKAVNKMSASMRKEFGSDATLADFLGLNSKSELSKLRRAGALAVEAEKAGRTALPSLSVVTEMLVLEGDNYGKQKLLPVLDYAVENEITVREMRDYTKKFKKTSAKKPESNKQVKQETKTPDKNGNVEGKVNKSPLPELDVALVWANSECLSKLTSKQRTEMATQINEILTKYSVAAAVMTEN